MCGIAGYVASAPAVARSVLEEMTNRLAHRGPDASGYFHGDGIALGHRRLSIIDLAGGDQPLGNEDGAIQVIFNGEIYNYRELREELIAKGHHFATHSDTEVLVHLYEEEGEQLPERLNGMFAFAIWDGRRRELFLARDRFGKKPLYYSTEVPGFPICFASELKALLVVPGLDRAVNPRSVANFLRFSYVPDPDTIFRRVNKLAPGHSLLFGRGGARLRRYWRNSFQAGDLPENESVHEQFRRLSLDSVQRRMISDVPLGGFLSGGVDSASVLALMSQCATGPVKSFSIGFSNKRFDELDYARLAARQFGTEHHEHVVTPSIGEMLQVHVEHYDEPFADSSAIATLYLARMTRRHVTVALSGDGADEVFGGYRRYRFALAEERLRRRLPGWFRRAVIGPAAALYPKFDYLPRVFRAKATLAALSQDLGHSYFDAMTGFRWGLFDGVLSPDLRRSLHNYSPREWFLDKFAAHAELPPLQQLQAVDYETYLPGDILVKVDRATMAYSLEARCPWLDYRLAEFSGRLDPSLLIRHGVGKFILKNLARTLIPREIIDRPKMGFGVPMAEWMRTSLTPVFERLVFRREMEEFLNLGAVRKIWSVHRSARRDHSRELWAILTLACWHDRYGGASPGGLLNETA